MPISRSPGGNWVISVRVKCTLKTPGPVMAMCPSRLVPVSSGAVPYFPEYRNEIVTVAPVRSTGALVVGSTT